MFLIELTETPATFTMEEPYALDCKAFQPEHKAGELKISTKVIKTGAVGCKGKLTATVSQNFEKMLVRERYYLTRLLLKYKSA